MLNNDIDVEYYPPKGTANEPPARRRLFKFRTGKQVPRRPPTNPSATPEIIDLSDDEPPPNTQPSQEPNTQTTQEQTTQPQQEQTTDPPNVPSDYIPQHIFQIPIKPNQPRYNHYLDP